MVVGGCHYLDLIDKKESERLPLVRSVLMESPSVNMDIFEDSVGGGKLEELQKKRKRIAYEKEYFMRMLKDIEGNIFRDSEDYYLDPTSIVESVRAKNGDMNNTSAQNVIENLLDKTYPKTRHQKSQIPTLKLKPTQRHSWHIPTHASKKQHTSITKPVSQDPKRSISAERKSQRTLPKALPGKRSTVSPFSTSSTSSTSSSNGSKCLSLEVVGHSNLSTSSCSSTHSSIHDSSSMCSPKSLTSVPKTGDAILYANRRLPDVNRHPASAPAQATRKKRERIERRKNIIDRLHHEVMFKGHLLRRCTMGASPPSETQNVAPIRALVL